MSTGWIILLAAAVVLVVSVAAWIAALPWLRRGLTGDPLLGLLWRILRVYVRIWHRARFRGLEHLRDQMRPGPLIVVSNHTGAIDPLLIQAGCRFHIRWMMASETMSPMLNFLWRRIEPIPVDRDGRDSGPAREAIRHVNEGGVVGIFPEGRIVWPPRQIRPFFLGVGLIVARAKAPVMLVWISGTPNTNSMWRSLVRPSRARVVYVEVMDFQNVRDAHEITHQLRDRVAAVSGWPKTDEPQSRAD